MDIRLISVRAAFAVLTLLIISGGLLWKRVWLPVGFYIITVSVAVIVPLIFWHGKLHLAEVLVALAVALFLTNAYLVYSNYRVLPFADSYADYASLKSTLSQARSIILPGEFGRLQIASGWPGLQFLAVSVIHTTNLDSGVAMIPIVLVLNLAYFVFAYLIVENLRRIWGLSKSLPALALLLLSGSGLGISLYLFGHANMGLVLFTLFLWVLFRREFVGSSAIVLLVTVGGLTVSHHLASMVTLILLAVLSLGFVLPWPRSAEWRSEQKSGRRFVAALSLISLATIVSWFNYRTSFFWPSIIQLSARLAKLLSLIGLKDMRNILTPSSEYPVPLTPRAGLLVLELRDLVFVLLVLGGVLAVLIRHRDFRLGVTVACSGAACLMLFLVSAIATWLGQRVFEFAYPLVATIGAIFLSGLFRAKGQIPRVVASVALGTIVVGGFLGLWGHRYIPRQVYDPSVEACVVGEHPRRLETAAGFLQNHLAYDKIRKYASDDYNLLFALLPATEFPKLTQGAEVARSVSGKLGVDLAKPPAGTIFVQLKCLNVYEYFSRYPTYVEAVEARPALSSRLDEGFDRIYNDGGAQVWRN